MFGKWRFLRYELKWNKSGVIYIFDDPEQIGYSDFIQINKKIFVFIFNFIFNYFFKFKFYRNTPSSWPMMKTKLERSEWKCTRWLFFLIDALQLS